MSAKPVEDARVDTMGDAIDSPTAPAYGGVVSNDQPSQLPWVVDANGRDVRTGGPGGLFVARTYAIPIEDNPNDAYQSEQRANAAFIVTAVNSHADLLAALKACLPFIDDAGDVQQFFPDSAASAACRAAVRAADDAIAKAEGHE